MAGQIKIIIAPDKFKGSLSSAAVCAAVKQGIRDADAGILVHSFPMADGGDGFADAMQYYTGTVAVNCSSLDPLNRPIPAKYQWNEKEATAIIELAAASGLVLLLEEERNPLLTSTAGTGLLIRDAIARGAKKIILGIGGSATSDAGTGILSALGFVFTDSAGQVVYPCGGNLARMQHIIVPDDLPPVQFEIACDVQNILYGLQGAAFVYGPQKGANARQVQLLDQGLRHFAELLNIHGLRDRSAEPGLGAAGGIAAGLLPFFNASLKQGSEMIIAASGIESALPGANLIVTGEGKLDQQSKDGKLVSSITKLAGRYHIPVMAFCGSLQLDDAAVKALGLVAAYAIQNPALSLEQNMQQASTLLQQKTRAVFQDFLRSQKNT